MPLSQIAKKERISLGYLERLFAQLKKAGIVNAEIGAGGGYKLANDPKKILIYDIVKTLEGKMSPFHCMDEKGKIYCDNKCRCGVTGVLVKVQEAVNNTLKSITLADLL